VTTPRPTTRFGRAVRMLSRKTASLLRGVSPRPRSVADQAEHERTERLARLRGSRIRVKATVACSEPQLGPCALDVAHTLTACGDLRIDHVAAPRVMEGHAALSTGPRGLSYFRIGAKWVFLRIFLWRLRVRAGCSHPIAHSLHLIVARPSRQPEPVEGNGRVRHRVSPHQIVCVTAD
jgi:hypothetical protein